MCVPRGQSDRGADADVAAAAADVASHGGIDVSVAGVGILGQQSRGGHDLAGLAVAALHDLKFAPGVLDALAGRGIANCFDGDNFPPASSATGVTQERVGPAYAQREFWLILALCVLHQDTSIWVVEDLLRSLIIMVNIVSFPSCPRQSGVATLSWSRTLSPLFSPFTL